MSKSTAIPNVLGYGLARCDCSQKAVRLMPDGPESYKVCWDNRNRDRSRDGRDMGLGHEKKVLDKTESRNRKDELDRMATMLSRLGEREYQVREEQASYSIDFDPDSDFDPEERKSQQADPLDARTSRQ